MKKIVLLFALISINTFSQCIDPVITDFECSGPSHGTYPANLITIANSFSGGINTSPNIGQYTDDGTNAWDALILDYGTAIDLSSNNLLKIKIYTSKSIQILAKIEGGIVAEKWSDWSTVNTWEEFTFDFSDFASNGNTKIALFFNGAQSDGTPTDLYYIDDLRWESGTLGIDDFKVSTEFNIYPNPSSDIVTINSSVEMNELLLSDISGKKVLKIKLENLKSYPLDLTSLKDGIYFLKINANNTLKNIKIIKQ
jgi:hypothetical protein